MAGATAATQRRIPNLHAAGAVFGSGELRQRRIALALTQAALAGLLGVTANTVARWERGEQTIGHPERVRRTLEDLAAGLQAGQVLEVTRSLAMPSELSSFIGREREVLEVTHLLAAHRLVTLTGAGGVGKTRLALRVAADVGEQFMDGVFFVPLAPITDPVLVLARIAQLLEIGHTGASSVLGRLQQVLHARKLLLVLDNFEQVLPAGLLMVELLRACSSLSALVTSRAVLHVYGEHTFSVPPLAFPELDPPAPLERMHQYAAVRLFIERAQAVQPDFAVTNETAPEVAEICWRLDGLPLAIELAAARVRVLPPATILARLGRRLELLVDGPRDQPARHQTLRAAIAWSYDLLAPGEKTLFRRLAVFAGGCTLEAAAALNSSGPEKSTVDQSDADTLMHITALVEQGLVQAGQQRDHAPRFWLLQTVREYALEQLGVGADQSSARERHATYFLALAEDVGTEERTWGPDGQVCLDVLEREHDNLRAALRWAIDAGRAETALRLGSAIWRMWFLRGHFAEARAWLREVLALPLGAERTRVRAALLNGAGMQANRQGDYSAAEVFHAESLAIARDTGDRLVEAHALNSLGFSAAYRGDHSRARTLYTDALGLYRSLGCEVRAALCLANLASVACEEEAFAIALRWSSEAIAIGRAQGTAYITAHALRNWGYAELGLGDPVAARVAFDDGLVLAHTVKAPFLIAELLEALGRTAASLGSLVDAHARFVESLQMHRQQGGRFGIIQCLEGLASLAASEGKLGQALRLGGAATALREQLGSPRSPWSHRLLEGWLTPAQESVGYNESERLWIEGRGLSAEQAAALILVAPESESTPEAGLAGESQHQFQGVTNREKDVLRLIASGHSNREIAAALFLSVRTVERHITSLYGKIDARGRADATAYALRQSLA